ncbi:type III-A CRISPR-associated protein Csm2 [uncultured Senegalimassilia sp.]|uniref:type III-A CRISPR-associated protein Csm2 n=1 Tax=uncultured Senegalimassilia sp. TaxID=1714350 RepID=UPI0025EEDF91|nr:type III-A CRISPR-associated protein Csm2 [uncultured Senegalimassilia sp.]
MQAKPTVSLRISEKAEINDLNFAFKAEQFIVPLDENTQSRRFAFSQLSMSKLRSIYSLITNIHARVNTPEDLEACMSDLQYIKVKMAYESGRERNKDVKDFISMTHLMDLLDQIHTYEQFVLYCRYAESLVAYFKFYGGRE